MRVFFACPITSYLSQVGSNLTLDPLYKSFLITVEQGLLEAGHEVFLAIRKEEFGAALRPPELCTPFDMLEMETADCVVVFAGKSYGTHVELGWAAALNKPLIIIDQENEQETTPLLTGLSSVSRSWRIKVSPLIMQSRSEQHQLCREILVNLASISIGSRKINACAFLSTSFGFGPVSKAESIAREIKKQATFLTTHFFGSGIDYEFALKSPEFDRVYKLDVDCEEIVQELAELLTHYSAIFSIMNHQILKHWRRCDVPLYLIDSLTWMWVAPPPGLNKVERYFVQDYLAPVHELKRWREEASLTLVAPIVKANKKEVTQETSSQLLVNFSGCANPFATGNLYREYVEVLSDAILEKAGDRFEKIIFCCNKQLSEHLSQYLKNYPNVQVCHASHDLFLRFLNNSEMLLTAPGITTTIEALSMNIPVGFLLPQNYSQSLLSENYRVSLGESAGMALSRFGEEFRIPPKMEEREGVVLTLSHLEEILTTRILEIKEMIGDLLSGSSVEVTARLKQNITVKWERTGQEMIVSDFLNFHKQALSHST